MDHERHQAALEETRGILESLKNVALRPGHRGEPSQALLGWAWKYLEERAAAGKTTALTPLLRLPEAVWSALADCFKGEGAYAATSPRLRVVLQAASHGPVSVEHGFEWIPQPITTAYGSVDGDVGHGVGIATLIAAGDHLEVPSKYVVSQLRKYCIESWPEHYWETSGAIPEKTYLVEVGYYWLDSSGNRTGFGPGQSGSGSAPKTRQRKQRAQDDAAGMVEADQ